MADKRRPTLTTKTYADASTLHAHDDHHQVVLPVDGTMRMKVAGTPGDIAHLASGPQGVMVGRSLPHEFQVAGANRFVVLDFPVEGRRGPDFAAGVIDRARLTPFFALDEGFRHLALYLAHALDQGALPEGLARQAIDLVSHAVTRALPPDTADDGVAKVIGHIHARFPERLTVGRLAGEIGVSASVLHERFRLVTGHAPIEYLQSVRLDEAERLLRASRLSIAEIALRVGFSDQTALTRALKRRRGVTPAVVRKVG